MLWLSVQGTPGTRHGISGGSARSPARFVSRQLLRPIHGSLGSSVRWGRHSGLVWGEAAHRAALGWHMDPDLRPQVRKGCSQGHVSGQGKSFTVGGWRTPTQTLHPMTGRPVLGTCSSCISPTRERRRAMWAGPGLPGLTVTGAPNNSHGQKLMDRSSRGRLADWEGCVLE